MLLQRSSLRYVSTPWCYDDLATMPSLIRRTFLLASMILYLHIILQAKLWSALQNLPPRC